MSSIETKKLRKVFGPIEAVQGVSFRVDKGEVLGFLGPNGAGKSTVMRMITCFLPPTSGTTTVGGHDILEDSMAVRQCVGYVPESNPLYNDMTADSFLRFIAEMRGYEKSEANKRIDQVIETCWLTEVRHQPLETLSKGFKRRVGLAQALIHDPPILILDEPTDGLDPNQKHEVRTLIRRMAPEKVTIISTHILEEVDAVCSRAIIIADGRIVADGSPDELKARSRYHGAVRLGLGLSDGHPPQDEVTSALRSLDDVGEVELLGTSDDELRYMVFPKNGAHVSPSIVGLVKQKQWEVREITQETGHLNDVFREITTRKEGAHA